MKIRLKTEILTNVSKCSTSFGDLDPKADQPIECKNIMLSQTTWSMQDGERYVNVYKRIYNHSTYNHFSCVHFFYFDLYILNHSTYDFPPLYCDHCIFTGYV